MRVCPLLSEQYKDKKKGGKNSYNKLYVTIYERKVLLWWFLSSWKKKTGQIHKNLVVKKKEIFLLPE